MKQPRIISVISFPFLPATTGGEICTAGLLQALSQHTVVSAFTVEPYKQGFEHQTGNTQLFYVMPFKTWRYANILLFFKLKAMAKQQQADWILFEQPWLGWLATLCKWFLPYKIAIRSHNIEYLRFKSMGKWFWQLLYMYEKWTYKQADLMLFLTQADLDKAVNEFDINPNKTLLAPYGVPFDTIPQRASATQIVELKEKLGIAAHEKMILFFSTLSYAPNYTAITDFVEHIYPLLKEKKFPFKLIVCGKNLPVNIQQQIEHINEIKYCGFVADIALYIDAADVMMNPILTGGGIKTKAIDTLARNQKVVSTESGAIGIDAKVCGNNLWIVADDDWKKFAEALINACDSTAQLPAEFYDTYSWQKISKHILKAMNP